MKRENFLSWTANQKQPISVGDASTASESPTQITTGIKSRTLVASQIRISPMVIAVWDLEAFDMLPALQRASA
jgi:hypothetical protein